MGIRVKPRVGRFAPENAGGVAGCLPGGRHVGHEVAVLRRGDGAPAARDREGCWWACVQTLEASPRHFPDPLDAVEPVILQTMGSAHWCLQITSRTSPRLG